MKNLFLFAIFLIYSGMNAQTLEGSWTLLEENGLKVDDKEVVRIYQDNYFSEGARNKETNEFLWAKGGEYTEGDYKEKIDFSTKNPEEVGETFNPELTFTEDGNKIKINNVTQVQVWKRLSAIQNDLSGNWVITGRKRDGEMSKSKPGDRRTIKILGGDRFQWVAFNSATGEFFGSGGGSYTAEDGKYTENIEFFSRDVNRVGASLGFDYKVENGEWHHMGKSSKGEPMYEIWEPYADAYHTN